MVGLGFFSCRSRDVLSFFLPKAITDWNITMAIHPTPSYIWPDTNKNITWLDLDDPLCANDTCLAFAEAHNASQALISWGSQFMYGHYVIMVWGCVLGLAMVAGSARRLQYFHASRSSIYLIED